MVQPFLKLQKYFLCTKKTKIMILFNNYFLLCQFLPSSVSDCFNNIWHNNLIFMMLLPAAIMIIISCKWTFLSFHELRFDQIACKHYKAQFLSFYATLKGLKHKKSKSIGCFINYKMLFIITYHYYPRNVIWVLHAFTSGFSFSVFSHYQWDLWKCSVWHPRPGFTQPS